MGDDIYSEKCKCFCDCGFYHTKKEKFCKFCDQHFHSIHEHDFSIHSNLDCIKCGMPQYMENTYPRCTEVTTKELNHAEYLGKEVNRLRILAGILEEDSYESRSIWCVGDEELIKLVNLAKQYR